jgi:hypothetical protein
VVAVAVYAFLPGFPENAHNDFRFINKRESDWVVQEINKDRGDALTVPYSHKKYLGSALDIKIWGFALIFLYAAASKSKRESTDLQSSATTCVTYAIAFFLPTM